MRSGLVRPVGCRLRRRLLRGLVDGGVVAAERVLLDEVELAYEVVGHGEPVVLVHGGLIASFFAPLLVERAA